MVGIGNLAHSPAIICSREIVDLTCQRHPEDILNEPFILRESGSGTRILCMRYLDRIGGGQPNDSVEMSSNETIKQAVIAGLGIALISFRTVTEELRAGRLIAPVVKDVPIMRNWFVLHPEDQTPTGASRAVLDFVRAQGAKGWVSAKTVTLPVEFIVTGRGQPLLVSG